MQLCRNLLQLLSLMTSTAVYSMRDEAVSCPWRCSCAERRGCTPIPTSPALWQTARTSASTPRSHTATVIPSTGSCSSPNQSSHLRNERERERLSTETLHFTVSLQLSSVNYCPCADYCQLSTQHCILNLTFNEL